RLETRTAERVADLVDGRIEARIARNPPVRIHEAHEVHGVGAVHAILQCEIGVFRAGRNRGPRRLRAESQRDRHRGGYGAHRIPVRSTSTSTPVFSWADSGARRPGHSAGASFRASK